MVRNFSFYLLVGLAAVGLILSAGTFYVASYCETRVLVQKELTKSTLRNLSSLESKGAQAETIVSRVREDLSLLQITLDDLQSQSSLKKLMIAVTFAWWVAIIVVVVRHKGQPSTPE